MCGDFLDKVSKSSNVSHSPRALAGIFLALADPIRLRMLNLMLKGEVSIPALAISLGQSPRILARHLIYLRAGGFVAAKRRGKTCFYFTYATVDTVESQLLQVALKSLRSAPETKLDEVLFEEMQKGQRKIRVSPQNNIPAWDNIGLYTKGISERPDQSL